MNPQKLTQGQRKKPTKRYHLDRRAHILIESGQGPPNELLNTEALAEWFGMSPAAVEAWRGHDVGPAYIELGPRMVRYRRGDCLAWLEQRIKLTTDSPSVKKRKEVAHA